MKSFSLKSVGVFAVLALTIGFAGSAQAELISNGSFEVTTIAGWDVQDGLTGLGGTSVYAVASPNTLTDVTGWTAVASPDVTAGGQCRWYVADEYAAIDTSMLVTPYGRLFFSLGNSSAVYQSFPVAVGNEYTVSYYEVNRGVTEWSGALGVTAAISGVSATGTLSQFANNVLTSGWTLQTFSFAPTASGTATLTFTGAAGNGGMFDNVSVMSVPVPEPSAVALLVMGLIGLLAYAWRKQK